MQMHRFGNSWIHALLKLKGLYLPLQTSELVEEVTCIVDAHHSLRAYIFCVYQKCLTVY